MCEDKGFKKILLTDLLKCLNDETLKFYDVDVIKFKGTLLAYKGDKFHGVIISTEPQM